MENHHVYWSLQNHGSWKPFWEGSGPYTKSRPSIFWVIHLSSMMKCPLHLWGSGYDSVSNCPYKTTGKNACFWGTTPRYRKGNCPGYYIYIPSRNVSVWSLSVHVHSFSLTPSYPLNWSSCIQLSSSCPISNCWRLPTAPLKCCKVFSQQLHRTTKLKPFFGHSAITDSYFLSPMYSMAS